MSGETVREVRREAIEVPIRSEIYGVAGRKQHGKDTFAKAVCAAAIRLHKSSEFEVTHFADSLKEMATHVFGLSREQFYDDVLKDAPLRSPIVMDMFVEAMVSATALPIKPAGLVAHTPREVMQFFGTDYVRATQDDYWAQRTVDGLRQPMRTTGGVVTATVRRRGICRRVLIPDTRFPNEVSALRAVGGKIIKVVRIDLPARENEHSSERAVDLIEPDLLLGVLTGDLRLVDRAAKLVALNRFSSTHALDYRHVEPALRRYAGGMSAEDTARLLGQKSPYTVYFLADYYGIPSRAKAAAQRVQHQIHDGVERKWCSKCVSWRPLGEFNASVKAWDRCSGWCSACTRAGSSAYDYSLRGMYKRMMRNAATRGLEWTLRQEDVDALWARQRGLCAYTGTAMTFAPNDPNKVSLDRVDATNGYNLSNVVLCGSRANLMKRNMSVSEFIAVCASVARHAEVDSVAEGHLVDPVECSVDADVAEENRCDRRPIMSG